MIKKAVIPCAGMGLRWLPISKVLPKELLPIINKPVIHYIVEEAIESGIKEIIIIINEKKKILASYFKSSPELELFLERKFLKDSLNSLSEIDNIRNKVNLIYIKQPYPLGLGQAVLLSRDVIGSEPFAIMLPDNLIVAAKPCLLQLIEIFREYQTSVLAIEKVKKDDLSQWGLIKGEPLNERVYLVQDMVEKPPAEKAPSDLGIVGRYVLSPTIFDFLEKTPPDAHGEIQLTDGLKLLLSTQKIYGYLYEGQRYDVGTPNGYLKAMIGLAPLRRKKEN